MRSGYRGPESVAGRGLAGGKGGGQGRRHLGAEGGPHYYVRENFQKNVSPSLIFYLGPKKCVESPKLSREN